jgi:tetratricopeptide (TPR) repeat protein
MICVATCSRVTPDERFSRANDAIVGQRYDDAVKEFNTLLRELRGDDRQTVKNRRKALYRLGRLQYLFLNRPDLALDCFKQVVAIDPRAPLSFNALAAMGRIYHDTMQDMAQAILAYQTLLAYFPGHRHADRYHHRLIEAYFKQGNFSQVRSEGMSAINALPKSPRADDILYLVGEAALLEGDKKGAEKAFLMLIERYPAGEWKGQSHYELGGILEERGDLAAALSHYEKAASALGGSPAVKRKIELLKKKAGSLQNATE